MACRLPGSPKPKHALVDDRHNRRWSTLPMGHYLALHICPPVPHFQVPIPSCSSSASQNLKCFPP